MLGEELIWRSSDAAVSSSGVQLGDTDGEGAAAFDMRRVGSAIRIALLVLLLAKDSAGSGCAGPGSVSAGGACDASERGTRNEPESGGVGRCEEGALGSGMDGRQLGST